jgi:hypothetical protein
MRMSIPGASASWTRVLVVPVVGSVLALCTLATPASAVPATLTPVVEVPAVMVAPAKAGPTSWRALNRAIAAIPNYRKGVASWVVDNAYGHYAVTNLNTRRIHVSRRVPPSRLFSVVAHEYGHALTVMNYAGNRRRLNAGLARHYPGGTIMNREYAADCMARLMGASWTHYTRCTNPRWRAAAATLLRGRRL